MPATTATAPGKIILFGEHSVVYRRPAIAAPVTQVSTRAVIQANPRGPAGEVYIQAPNIDLDAHLADLPAKHPLVVAILGVVTALQVSRLPAMNIRITSTIPVSAGLGSGAAVSVAVIRALGAFLGHPLPDEKVSNLAYEVEKLHHGTPSGIDNAVISFAKPVYFRRVDQDNTTIETFQAADPLPFVIADTGIPSPTAEAVSLVRRGWQADQELYENIFDAVETIVLAARQAIEGGTQEALGMLMDENQELLVKMGVSSPELDILVQSAREAGALGAKLSGGGRGGNMIALVTPETASLVTAALKRSGASHTILTHVK